MRLDTLPIPSSILPKMKNLYVIEARDSNGQLLLGDAPQPETVFGSRAITGMTDDEMAKVIFSKIPDVILTGDSILLWPRKINPNWTARRKTW